MKDPVGRDDWLFWNSLRCARFPLRLASGRQKLRPRLQMREFSDSAYLHRVFDLFFWGMRRPEVYGRLSVEERMALDEFVACFDRLPWRPLTAHPHISELVDDDLGVLAPFAKRLDRKIWLRIDRGVIPAIYRLVKD